MKSHKIIFFTFFFFFSYCFADEVKIDTLIDKVQHASSQKEKEILMEQLKEKLALVNKKNREESKAIIEAKKKMPSKKFENKDLQK